MAYSTYWWLAAGALIVVELLTGTFYLLMLALGMAAGALAAHLHASLSLQLVIAALVGGGAVGGWHLTRGRRRQQAVAANRNVNLDIGETVHVSSWDEDGTAKVRYRGAQWTVCRHSPNEPASPGAYRVCEVVGNRLVVKKIHP